MVSDNVAMTISENIFQKAKPGRPRTLDAEAERRTRRFLDLPVETLRTVQNKLHLGTAASILCDGGLGQVTKKSAKRWGWLLRPTSDGLVHPRMSIASQLGRCHKDAVPIFADRLCELKPRAADAIPLLREWQRKFEGIFICEILERGDSIGKDEIHGFAKTACRKA
jgi:hypothetical protein